MDQQTDLMKKLSREMSEQLDRLVEYTPPGEIRDIMMELSQNYRRQSLMMQRADELNVRLKQLVAELPGTKDA